MNLYKKCRMGESVVRSTSNTGNAMVSGDVFSLSASFMIHDHARTHDVASVLWAHAITTVTTSSVLHNVGTDP